ncbi:MAG: PDZ domain-containing protein [Starkeya sp.]|nr:PDZ domain-containing protein [Starkeya sp.]
MAAGLALHQNYWVGYALLTCILGFTLDTGGSAPHRAVLFAVAGAVILAGATLGSAVAGHVWLTATALVVAAALYALVEAVHPSAAFAARFFCLATAIAALDVPFQPGDVVTAVDGKPVTGAGDGAMLAGALRPGASVSVTVRRGDRQLPLAITLAP